MISRYDILVNRYKELVSEKLSRKDFIEYNEILFSAHSCAIEGNSFSVDETRTLKEKGLGMIPKGKTLLEAFEILDHFQAYEYLLKNLDRPLTEELLKETHRLLTEHTLSYKTQYDEIPSNPGEYTTVDMCAGDTIFGDHEQLIKQQLGGKDALVRTPRLIGKGRESLPRILPQICRACSDAERAADAASHATQKIKIAQYYEDRLGERYAGTVSWVSSMGLFVRLDLTQVEGLVSIKSLGNEWFEFDEDALTLTGADTGTRYELGQRVIIGVSRVNTTRGHLDFKLIH